MKTAARRLRAYRQETTMDDKLADFHRRNESWRLLAASATGSELKELWQSALDDALAGLTKLAKHYHGRGDYDQLHRAYAALIPADAVVSEMFEAAHKTVSAIQAHIAVSNSREGPETA
jgi:hypothetical protein